MKKILLALIFALPVIVHASTEAQCEISLKDKGSYKGPCTYTNKSKGSFFVIHPDFPKKLKVDGLGVHALLNDNALIENAKNFGYGKVLGTAHATFKNDVLCLKSKEIKLCIWE